MFKFFYDKLNGGKDEKEADKEKLAEFNKEVDKFHEKCDRIKKKYNGKDKGDQLFISVRLDS